MKKLNETLYEISWGLYAEMRDGQWFVTDEDEEIQGGPYATLELLEASLKPGAVEIRKIQGNEVVRVEQAPPGVEAPAEDLVTLREAAEHLNMTRQGLEYRRKKGILGVEPVVTGRSVELYSLRALKQKYGYRP